MTVAENNLICTRPFEWCEIHQDGSVFPCCPAWLARPIGNILTQTVEQCWNSRVAQEIRKSIHNHSFHNCKRQRCPFLATESGPVKSVDSVLDPDVREALQNETPLLPYPPRKLNLCFDHSCNLACPSCREKMQQAKGKPLERAQQISDLVMEQLIPHAREITLSGFGDPFGSPTYFSLLKRLNQQSGELPFIRLHTNGQLLTRELWEKLPKLHAQVTEAEISIDAGTAVTYAINRPGGTFERLLDNLDYLAAQPFQLTLSMVVQRNNFREIPQLIELAGRLNAKVYLSQLVNWGTFTREEFLSRAVHLEGHPEHAEFKAVIRNLPDDKSIETGNLISVDEYKKQLEKSSKH